MHSFIFKKGTKRIYLNHISFLTVTCFFYTAPVFWKYYTVDCFILVLDCFSTMLISNLYFFYFFFAIILHHYIFPLNIFEIKINNCCCLFFFFNVCSEFPHTNGWEKVTETLPHNKSNPTTSSCKMTVKCLACLVCSPDLHLKSDTSYRRLKCQAERI